MRSATSGLSDVSFYADLTVWIFLLVSRRGLEYGEQQAITKVVWYTIVSLQCWSVCYALLIQRSKDWVLSLAQRSVYLWQHSTFAGGFSGEDVFKVDRVSVLCFKIPKTRSILRI
jgi:hypothetical protein